MATRRKRKVDSGDIDNFFISWGDLVSLLLVLFIYLYSISEIDPVKFLEANKSIKESIASSDTDFSELEKIIEERKMLKETKEKLEEYIQEEGIADVFSVEFIEDRVEINLGNTLLFEQASAELRDEAKKVLKVVSKSFQETSGNIMIEGHTDDLSIKTKQYPSNWELSSARASSVARYFEERGVTRKRCRVMGLSDTHPLVPNINRVNRAKNRRVKVIIKAGTPS